LTNNNPGKIQIPATALDAERVINLRARKGLASKLLLPWMTWKLE